MRLVAATLVAFGSVVSFVGLSGAESSGLSARLGPERIAFAQGWVSFRGDESFEIWTMSPNGTRKRQLTRQGGRDPAWSPDGRRLAYVRFIPGRRGINTTIYVMNADGSGQRRLLRGPTSSYIASPTWSPDGRNIAFVRDMGITNVEIWVMNADGTHQRRLTRNAALDYAPDWSPDGNRIVFERGNVTKRAIWVMNADGTGQRRLTRSAKSDGSPDWSNDGRRIVFERQSLIGSHIWVMNANGRGQRQIARGTGREPSWSADDRRIVFVRAVDIHVMNADGTHERRLTRNKVFDDGGIEPDDPEWSAVG